MPASKPKQKLWYGRRPIATVAMAIAAVGGAWFALAALTGSEGGPIVIDPTDAELVRLGRVVYTEQCASCHGVELEGQLDWRTRLPDGTLPAPPHDESGHTWHHPDKLLFDIVKHGGQSLAPAGFKSGMPAFADVLSDREILASMAYIKSRWPSEISRRHDALNRQAR